MRKSYLTVVLGLTCLLWLGMTAHAEDLNKVVVDVQFEFAAGGKVMQAGTYTISRISQDPRSGLVLRSDNDSAILLPMAIGEASADQAGLGFEHVGNTYFLTKIETPGAVYTIETPREITKLARTKDRVNVSFSGN